MSCVLTRIGPIFAIGAVKLFPGAPFIAALFLSRFARSIARVAGSLLLGLEGGFKLNPLGRDAFRLGSRPRDFLFRRMLARMAIDECDDENFDAANPVRFGRDAGAVRPLRSGGGAGGDPLLSRVWLQAGHYRPVQFSGYG